MKVLHLVLRDDGGVGRAAIRNHHALRDIGVDSVVALGTGTESPPEHIFSMQHPAQRWWMQWAPALHRRALRVRYGSAAIHLRTSRVPGLIASTIRRHNPDVIQLHGVFDGLVSARQVASFPVPVVWTLHDMLPFSPGYHYRGDMMDLPKEHGPLFDDHWPAATKRLATRIFQHKLSCLGTPKGAVTAPSAWLADEARESEIFRNWEVSHIHHAFPKESWPAADPVSAKAAFRLAHDSRCLLFGAEGASAPRKGADLFLQALRRLSASLDPSITSKIVLLVFGASEGMDWQAGDIQIRHLGRINDTSVLAQAYSAADVFVCPSREDNSPNTVVEALACGTPTIAFHQGGLPDLIEDGRNGFLVPPYDIEAMAKALERAIHHPSFLPRSEIQSNIFALSDPASRAADYQRIYQQVIASPRAQALQTRS